MHTSRRVLVVFHEDVLGGATVSTLRAISVMRERGWDYTFFVADPSPLADHLRDQGYRVLGTERHVGFSLKWLRHPPGPRHKLRSMPAYFAAYVRALRAVRPDLVHANSLYSMAEALIARALGFRVLFHVHEILNTNWKGPAARRVASAAGLRAIAVSQASAARYAGPGATVPVVHESTTLPPAVVPLGERDGQVVVGTVGNVCPRKGSDLFVEAARLLAERAPGVKLEMVGPVLDDPDRPWAEAVLDRARRFGVDHTARDDVFARLAGWDVFVMPSRWDPFPLVVLEAMASERPVIATAVDGIPEQLGDGAGVLVEPENAAALAEAIAALAGDPERRRTLARAGRERVLARYTPEHQAAELEREYAALLFPDG
jgi:glycosyltransferase involved in cell wall biosynthesis